MLTLNGQLVLRDGVWKEMQILDAALPESITLAVAQRLAGLSSACRELLRVASLFGRTFPLSALVAVMGQDEEQVEALIDEATRAAVIAKGLPLMPEDASTGYLALTSPTYMFCQGIVQEALSGEVPAHRARSLHGAIGAALEAEISFNSPGGGAIAHAAELARHYALSGEKSAALRWSLLAGEDAARQQAHREAITHFRLALKLLDEGIYLKAADMARGRSATTFPTPGRMHILIGESWFKLVSWSRRRGLFSRRLRCYGM